MNRPADTASVLETAAQTMQNVASEFNATVDSAAELARATGRLADRRIHERPWQAALIAAGIGVLVGLAMRSGRRY